MFDGEPIFGMPGSRSPTFFSDYGLGHGLCFGFRYGRNTVKEYACHNGISQSGNHEVVIVVGPCIRACLNKTCSSHNITDL
jgi:hypothetical protein